LAASLAKEKETIQEQTADARQGLDADAHRIAAEISGRVLKRPVG
jgi:hypothetical protein